MKNNIIIFVIIFFVGIGVYFLPQKQLAENSEGEALIGGHFLLTDHHGNQVEESDFRGRFMLVFFGFTHCPNICPTDLFIMSEAMNLLGDDNEEIVPIFITIDPERDTQEVMASYISNFHKSFIGLTGTMEQIEQAAKAYRIYYAKVKDPNSNLGYTMDHSTFTYLMDKNGKYLSHFGHNTKAHDMAEAIRNYIRR